MRARKTARLDAESNPSALTVFVLDLESPRRAVLGFVHTDSDRRVDANRFACVRILLQADLDPDDTTSAYVRRDGAQ